jgi:hypothetical protein
VRNRKRQSQAEPLEGAEVFFQLTSTVVKWSVVPGREFQELLDRHPAQFGGPAERNLVLPVEFDGQQSSSLDRWVAGI